VQRETGSQLTERVCPICQTASTPGDVLVRAPIRAVSLDADERDEYWRGFRSRTCFFDFARCSRCALLFCPTYYSQASLDRLYSSMPDNTAGADASVLSDTQESYIEYLARHRMLRGTYMEIGPDIGLSTQAACTRGSLDRVILVEPNRDVHEQLRAATGDVPADIFESIEQLASTDRADNVVLVHVLDHLIDPLAYLKEIRLHMAPGAFLLAVVHNEASLLRRILGVRWPPFCLQHPQLYSSETLGRLFAEAGLAVIGSVPTKNVLPLRHVVRTASSLLGISGPWTDRLPETKLRLRLGNIMMVARA
jgi:SAM-dependent methyltransferase